LIGCKVFVRKKSVCCGEGIATVENRLPEEEKKKVRVA